MAEQEQESLEERAFKDWLMHPVTQKLRVQLRDKREAFRERWESGEFTDLSKYGTAILNAKAIGCVEQIVWLLELEWTDLEEDDGQSNSKGA